MICVTQKALTLRGDHAEWVVRAPVGALLEPGYATVYLDQIWAEYMKQGDK